MLYDPKWTRELTVLGFINWLKTQDPKGSYNYIDPRHCALCQYMKEALGFKKPAISPTMGYGEAAGVRRDYDPVLDEIVDGRKSGWTRDEKWKDLWTYGKALERAEALLKEEKENAV